MVRLSSATSTMPWVTGGGEGWGRGGGGRETSSSRSVPGVLSGWVGSYILSAVPRLILSIFFIQRMKKKIPRPISMNAGNEQEQYIYFLSGLAGPVQGEGSTGPFSDFFIERCNSISVIRVSGATAETGT